jgi:hypothetical protein
MAGSTRIGTSLPSKFCASYPAVRIPLSAVAECRQYNWPHQLSVYYALYRVARDWTGLATAAGLRHGWDWYLDMSAVTLTQMACPDPVTGVMTCIPDVSSIAGVLLHANVQMGVGVLLPCGQLQVGLMDGTVFREILDALTVEAAAGSPSPGQYTWAQWAANVTQVNLERRKSACF